MFASKRPVSSWCVAEEGINWKFLRSPCSLASDGSLALIAATAAFAFFPHRASKLARLPTSRNQPAITKRATLRLRTQRREDGCP